MGSVRPLGFRVGRTGFVIVWGPPANHRPPSGGGAGTPFCRFRGAARPPQPPECHVRGLTEVWVGSVLREGPCGELAPVAPAYHRPPSGGGAGTPFCPIRGAARHLGWDKTCAHRDVTARIAWRRLSRACHDRTRRSLEKDLERRSVSPSQSPREFRAVRAGDAGSTGRRHMNNEPAHDQHSRGQPLEVLPPTSARPFSHALLPTASALLSAIASDAQRRLLCTECRPHAVADSKIMRLRSRTLPANDAPLQRRRLRRPGVRQLRLKHVPSGRERK